MDRFAYNKDTVADPARSAVAGTPSDTGSLAIISKALYVGTGGDLSLVLADDQDAVTLRNIPSGSIIPVRATQILDAGTTADHIVVLR